MLKLLLFSCCLGAVFSEPQAYGLPARTFEETKPNFLAHELPQNVDLEQRNLFVYPGLLNSVEGAVAPQLPDDSALYKSAETYGLPAVRHEIPQVSVNDQATKESDGTVGRYAQQLLNAAIAIRGQTENDGPTVEQVPASLLQAQTTYEETSKTDQAPKFRINVLPLVSTRTSVPYEEQIREDVNGHIPTVATSYPTEYEVELEHPVETHVRTEEKPLRFIVIYQRQESAGHPVISTASYLTQDLPLNTPHQDLPAGVVAIRKEVPLVLPLPHDYHLATPSGSISSTFISKDEGPCTQGSQPLIDHQSFQRGHESGEGSGISTRISAPQTAYGVPDIE